MHVRFWWRNNEDGSAAYYVRERARHRLYVDVLLEAHDALPENAPALLIRSHRARVHAATRIVEATELDATGQPKPPSRYRFHFSLEEGSSWPFEVTTELVLMASDKASEDQQAPPERLEGALTVVPSRSRAAARWLAAAALLCGIYLLWVINLTSPAEPLVKLGASVAALVSGVGAPLVASFLSKSRLPQLGFFLDWRWPLTALTLAIALFAVATFFPCSIWVENRTAGNIDFSRGSAPSGERVLLLQNETEIRNRLAELGSTYCVQQPDCHYPKESPVRRFWEWLVYFPRVAIGCRRVSVVPPGSPGVTPDDTCSFEGAQLTIDTGKSSATSLPALLRARGWTQSGALQKIRLAFPGGRGRELSAPDAPWDLSKELAENVFIEPDRPRPDFDLRIQGRGVVQEVEAALGPGLILTPASIDDTGVAAFHAQVTRRNSPDEVSLLSCSVPAVVSGFVTLLSPPPRSSAYLSDLIVIDGSLTVSHWRALKPQLMPLPLACRAGESKELLTDGIPDQLVLFLSDAWYPEQRWRFEWPAPLPTQFTIYSNQTRALGTLKCRLPGTGGTGVEIGPVAIASEDRKPLRQLEVWNGAKTGDPMSIWKIADTAPASMALWPWACKPVGVPASSTGTSDPQPLDPRLVGDGRPGRLLPDGVVFDTVVERRCNIVKTELQILQSSAGFKCEPDRLMGSWL